jgi:two-component system cell cycle sensor histidine kinase/response regulator CckA
VSQASPTESPIRIIQLEDNPLDAELCVRKLKSAGLKFTAKLVGTSEEFKLEVRTNPYDIILGDYRLPNWTGLDALCWLREFGYSIPFILITGSLGDERASECIKEGAADYLLKGRLERLPLAIGRALEEKRVRESRDRLEQQYASVIQGAPYGIYRATQDGQIVMANPAMVAMLGYESEAELLQLNMSSDVYADARVEQQILSSTNHANALQQTEVSWRRKDGRAITERLAGRRLVAETGGTYEVFAQDITEQRIMERQFQQAQKMESIGRLAGGVAHDFNNLLTVIRGGAYLLERNLSNPEKVADYLKQINGATTIAASVVEQLMAFSRMENPERSALDLNEVLANLRKMLPRLLGEDIEVIFQAGEKLKRISADRAQMEQIILNLAVNARDAMPDGGKLVIETANVHLDEAQARSGTTPPAGDYVALTVRDTGTGMDATIQEHIFEPFFTTKERGKGTGLGMATVYGIVKESEGFISLESAPGKGSSFKMHFPGLQTSEEVPSPVSVAATPVGGSETILLVEDETALREITCEYLQSMGYHVLAADNGLNALEICRTHDGPIHILLTDIVMPGIRGTELVKAAVAVRPELHVIYVSGYADRGIEAGPLGKNAIFLQKPYSLAELDHTIRTAAAL